MSKTFTYKGVNFGKINPEQVRQLVTDLYESYQLEKRGFQFGITNDRRDTERRQDEKYVLLDTRATRCRRQSSGRRQRDENQDNKHKVGIDYYV